MSDRAGQVWEYAHVDGSSTLVLIVGVREMSYWLALNLENGMRWSIASSQFEIAESKPGMYSWRRYL